MITVFNRRELFVTFSIEEQARVRAALDAAGIDYSVKTINRNSPSALNDTRARTGTLGQNMSIAYEYRIFVRKEDYDRAAGALHDCIR